MIMKRISLFVFVAYCLTMPIKADLLFDTGPGNNTTFRPAGFGPGQGITVSTTTNLTNMAMDLNMPSGGDIKYMIWNGTNTTLLFSETQAVAASASPTFVLSTPFSFTLNAGQTYYFGVIGDNNLDVNFYFPPQASTQNGLTEVISGNSNYSNFDSPTNSGPGFATITLQLYGSQGAVPEPRGEIVPLVAILGILGVVMRRRFRNANFRTVPDFEKTSVYHQ